MFVSLSKYRDLQARYETALKAVGDSEEQVCTIVRLTREVDELRKSAIAPQTAPKSDTGLGGDRPGAQFWDPRPVHGEAELRRRLGLAEAARRALEGQLLPLQQANEAMAAELRDLREGSEARA